MILSTNIAETSITISGIKFVVDTGMVKAKKYSPGEQFCGGTGPRLGLGLYKLLEAISPAERGFQIPSVLFKLMSQIWGVGNCGIFVGFFEYQP